MNGRPAERTLVIWCQAVLVAVVMPLTTRMPRSRESSSTSTRDCTSCVSSGRVKRFSRPSTEGALLVRLTSGSMALSMPATAAAA
jgi:hypothetical protein